MRGRPAARGNGDAREWCSLSPRALVELIPLRLYPLWGRPTSAGCYLGS